MWKLRQWNASLFLSSLKMLLPSCSCRLSFRHVQIRREEVGKKKYNCMLKTATVFLCSDSVGHLLTVRVPLTHACCNWKILTRTNAHLLSQLNYRRYERNYTKMVRKIWDNYHSRTWGRFTCGGQRPFNDLLTLAVFPYLNESILICPVSLALFGSQCRLRFSSNQQPLFDHQAMIHSVFSAHA